MHFLFLQDEQRLIEKAWRVWRQRHLQSCVVQNFLEEESRSLLSQVSIYDCFNSVDLSGQKSTPKRQLVFPPSQCTKHLLRGKSNTSRTGTCLQQREIASSFMWVHLWVFFKALCQQSVSLLCAPFLTVIRDVNPVTPASQEPTQERNSFTLVQNCADSHPGTGKLL